MHDEAEPDGSAFEGADVRVLAPGDDLLDGVAEDLGALVELAAGDWPSVPVLDSARTPPTAGVEKFMTSSSPAKVRDLVTIWPPPYPAWTETKPSVR